VSRIPDIRDELDFSNTELGLLFLGAAAGALLSMPIASRSMDACGSAKTLIIGNVMLCLSFSYLGSSNVLGATVGIICMGFGVTMSDVSMTAHGIAVEKLTQSTSLGKLSVLTGVGCVLGCFMGGLLADYGVSTVVHFLLVGFCTLPVSLVMYTWTIDKTSEDKVISGGRMLSGGSLILRGMSVTSSVNKYEEFSQSRELLLSGDDYMISAPWESDCSSQCHDDSSQDEYGRYGVFADMYMTESPAPELMCNTSTAGTPTLPSRHRHLHSLSPSHHRDSQATSLGEAAHDPSRTVRLLCVLGIISELVNGSMTNWLVVFIKDDVKSSLNNNSLSHASGYMVFAASGVVGQLLCDVLTQLYFRQTVLRSAGCLVVLGLLLVALSGSDLHGWLSGEHGSSLAVVFTLAGSAMIGGSISCILKVLFSSSGDIPRTISSEVAPKITSLSYIAYLCGPPAFGYISDLSGDLKYVFIILAVLSVGLVLFPGQIPHNSEGLLKILKQKRAQFQSTDFAWHSVDHIASERAGVATSSVNQNGSESIGSGVDVASDGLKRQNTRICEGENDSLLAVDIDDKSICRPAFERLDSTRSTRSRRDESIDDVTKINAINKHLSVNKYPVF